MRKVLHMPKRAATPEDLGKTTTPARVISIIPDAEEEHASLATINRWVSLADSILTEAKAQKKA